MPGRALGEALSPSRNSLNFLRLCLACVVILSHAVDFGLYRPGDSLHGTELGTIAVWGFFGISGYLIAGSALHNNAGRYLWQRFLRIFPGFWVCLVATAFVFGVINWVSIPHPCASLSCYLHAHDGPFGYLYHDWLLKIDQTSISGTPSGRYGTLAWTAWNGSLWTLIHEFLCYVLLLGLSVAGLLKRRLTVLILTAGLFVAIGVFTLDSGFTAHFNLYENWFLMNFMKFAAIFLVGSLLYLYRDRVPDSGWMAIACTILFFGSLWIPDRGLLPGFYFTGSTYLAALIAYPLLWLGAHLPFQRVGARNDYSYGMYIYAFPLQQLLAVWGLTRLGYVVFASLSLVVTVPFAVASWWLVERHALRLKKTRFGRASPPPAPSDSASPQSAGGRSAEGADPVADLVEASERMAPAPE